MRIDRRILLSASALTALGGLAACSGTNRDPMSQTAQPPGTGSDGGAGTGGASDGAAEGTDGEPGGGITVGLTYIPNVQFSPFYLAVREKLFGDLQVTLRHHGEQEGLFEALQLGREDLVYASADEALVAGGLTSIATLYQTYPAEVILAGAGKRLADLKGGSLGIPGRFGSSYYAALLALQSAGLTEQDVTLTEIGYTGVSALATGQVDAIIGFVNNELVQLQTQKVAVTHLPVSPEATLVGPSLITTPQRAGEATLRRIVEGVAEAERRIAADPALGIEVTAEQVPALADPTQRMSAEAVLEATIPLWTGPEGQVDVSIDPSAEDRMRAFLREAGVLR